MWELLKDYLEKNEIFNYDNVEIKNFNEDGHKCSVDFSHNDNDFTTSVVIGLWDVMAFVHSNQKNIKN